MRGRIERFHFIDAEVEAMAWLAHLSEVPTRIIVQYNAQIDSVFKILFDHFDCPDFSARAPGLGCRRGREDEDAPDHRL